MKMTENKLTKKQVERIDKFLIGYWKELPYHDLLDLKLLVKKEHNKNEKRRISK